MADRTYRGISLGAGSVTVVVIVLIFLFLLIRSWPAISKRGIWSFLTTQEWLITRDPPIYGAAALLYGTTLVAVIALVIAVPLAVGSALYINEYAPRRLRGIMTSLIDLLAAVPSVIYGIFGITFLVSRMEGPSAWLSDYLGFIPLFADGPRTFRGSIANASVVVACMVLPIVTSVIREVFSQAPHSECEAAYALGSTRWGMVRTVIIPFGRGGIIGGSMLGLGRALGETIAIFLILQPSFEFVTQVLEPGGVTAASFIAGQFTSAGEFEIRALLGVGLALYLMTLVVNMAATVAVNRSRSGAGVEL